MVSMDGEKVKVAGNRDLLVIGAGLHGLVTAKVLLHSSQNRFSSVTIYEKNSALGGVWASNRIYDGLTTNSPLLTYEIPDFPFPKHRRVAGAHASAQEVNSYFQAYADAYSLTERIQYSTLVQDVSWDPESSTWSVKGTLNGAEFRKSFGFLVVCVGLYHTSLDPLESMINEFAGDIVHSSEIGEAQKREKLAASKQVIIVGAGKSALDLATILAKGQWTPKKSSAPAVTLVYRRPHWISPRKIVRKTVAFEKLLFSRFVNAWLPYVEAPDTFHRWIAETKFGRWQTKQIFKIVADDFVKSNGQQDLPLTIPDHPLSVALSGALHVEPPGYLNCVRSGDIRILEGSVSGLSGNNVSVRRNNGENTVLKADNLLVATGYKLALPFLSKKTCQTLGLLRPEDESADNCDLPYIRLYRLIVPPGSANSNGPKTPNPLGGHRNIAFNGFAYSLLNPTVAHVTANWIADYFSGNITLPAREPIEKDIDKYHAWQITSFGSHGTKGVHIGPHATLYTDTLLADMGLRSGHVARSYWNPSDFLHEWFRPMYPGIYAHLEADRRARVEPSATAALEKSEDGHSSSVVANIRKFFLCIWRYLHVFFMLFSTGDGATRR